MTIIEPGSAASGIIDRAKNLILQPSQEFERIDQETPSVASLYTGYAIPLAALSAIAIAVGNYFYGSSFFVFSVRPSLSGALSNAVLYFLWPLAAIWILAKVIDFLAPNFHAQRNEVKATQVAVYSATAAFLAALFHLLPSIGFLAILGFYSYYVLYRGLPRLMQCPPNQAASYTIAVVVTSILLGAVAMTISSQVQKLVTPSSHSIFGKHADPDATVSVPGFGEMKMGELQKKADDLQAMAKSMEAGKGIPALPTDTLKSLLPETLPGGFTRTAMSAGSGGAMGFSGATAEGVYTSGDSSIQLSVVDMAGASALMGMASAFGVEASQETDTSYSKTGKVDGRMTIEEADKTAKTASYSVVVADRIALSAQGQNVTSDDVKRAISAIGIPRVEALVKNAPKG